MRNEKGAKQKCERGSGGEGRQKSWECKWTNEMTLAALEGSTHTWAWGDAAASQSKATWKDWERESSIYATRRYSLEGTKMKSKE